MHVLLTALIGVIVGAIGKAVTPPIGPGGFVLTEALGIFGSVAGAHMGQFFGWYQPDEMAAFLSATLGAVALVSVFHWFVRD
jgi:uncharacterized membrane protein YeaQ/YmgE (transglycosylase-associated protein family)